jgi:hypothetical protein
MSQNIERLRTAYERFNRTREYDFNLLAPDFETPVCRSRRYRGRLARVLARSSSDYAANRLYMSLEPALSEDNLSMDQNGP